MHQQIISELNKATSNGVKKLSCIILALLMTFLVSFTARAQVMNPITNDQITDDHTAREEQEGRDLWQEIRTKENPCLDLTDKSFAMLGEYFMGQMLGSSHSAMNSMMTKMMGEAGEEQMHIAMGKRMSGCEPNAPIPQNMMNNGMMQMMMGGYPFLKGGDSNMMGNFGAYGPTGFFGFFGMLVMLIFWILIIVAVVALIRWLIVQSPGSGRSNSALDILKERYAKGEINKEEFESKKRDLI